MILQWISIPEQKLREFCSQYKVKRLALFGSVLSENFRSDSDVDILVVFDPSAKVSFLTLGKMKRELSGIIRRPVDLVPQDGLKLVIREAVLSTAQEIYAA